MSPRRGAEREPLRLPSVRTEVRHAASVEWRATAGIWSSAWWGADRSLKQAWQTSLQQAIEALQTLHTDASLAAQWRVLPAKEGAAPAAAPGRAAMTGLAKAWIRPTVISW